MTYTKAARAEAGDRVREKLRLGSSDLTWFRTIHAWYHLGLTTDQVMMFSLGALRRRPVAREPRDLRYRLLGPFKKHAQGTKGPA